MLDLLVIGAGPCGLAVAVEARRAGLSLLVVEKGTLTDALVRFPRQMTFFSTAELLEIGGYPFVSARPRPTRQEALEYYRRVAERESLPLRLWERAEAPRRLAGGGFAVPTERRDGGRDELRARCVVLATGYFDHPNLLGVPGEELEKVSHYYDEPYRYVGQEVLVVGGRNSAVETAMDLERHGARVTLVHRGPGLSEKVKPWVRPEMESLLAKGRVRAYWGSRVRAIRPDAVELETPEGPRTLANDFVLAMTGYRPDHRLLREAGVGIDPASGAPVHDPSSMETDVPGLFVAGVFAAGNDANSVFIENGRLHARPVVRRVQAILGRAS
ncbi:MAG: YpdA family putative bacillithiol disulfide reductase [Firmicutes bacterium]|nr:YpdA family putative bacillithiol disulfide reductase [Bacillota bacterium]